MTFQLQTHLQSQLPLVRELFARRGLDTTKIEGLAPLIEHFEIRIPFIGAFSSGKSSLINALIQEPLLSVEITPETASPAELRHGTQRRFYGQWPDGRTQPITQEDVQANHLSLLLPDGWLCAELPAPGLAAIPHLVLVDMPGWDSGVEAHQLVIDDYAHRSLAYAVVVSVEEGTLRSSLRSALLELAVQEKPVILVISKAHKRPADQASAVARQLAGEITQLMGRAPLAVATTAAHKRDAGQLQQALVQLESRAQSVFESSVAMPWRSTLQHAAQQMQLLSSQQFQDAERLQAEVDRFEQQMQDFDQRLTRETQALQERLPPMLETIRLQVESALAARLDALTDSALSGDNIGSEILGTARLVISQAVKTEFDPALHRYLDRLTDALPQQLSLGLNLDGLQASGKSSSGSGGSSTWQSLASFIQPLLHRYPNPVTQTLAAVLPLLARLFDSQANSEQQAIDEARQYERAKTRVRSALTGAVQQIENQLRPALETRIQNARDTVAQHIAADRADTERTLAAGRQALQDGEAQAAAQRAAAQADLQRIEQWLAALPSTPTESQAA